jgi:MSHA pilin protein MshC
MRPCQHRNEAGFTLIEMIIVMSVVGILSAYAIMKNSSPATYTLLSQAQTMASDIRHVQSLATTWGKSLRITAVAGTNGTYSVSCVTSGASPCNTNPVINPSTGAAFVVALQKDTVLSGPATLDINSLGQPSAAGAYILSTSEASMNVRVATLTGFVVVSP